MIHDFSIQDQRQRYVVAFCVATMRIIASEIGSTHPCRADALDRQADALEGLMDPEPLPFPYEPSEGCYEPSTDDEAYYREVIASWRV